ncbi:thiol reductant ABC exporter subunit CydD [Alicyclobacillus sp. SO9]|uniref:thiol reductant ABC exporter subunit CydD n=1 Tax=Alicyclobacillus sp. SO9 TaxID=2665646 RepID=UPI0018E8E037|nr:thiol reductant ABC exporter subunit CydD [Alicyclobacillus sp. SO9]QQE78666.1 thiol reductant ABC exporter subunit CydD [Alicyclobacillus sp. SO9]
MEKASKNQATPNSVNELTKRLINRVGAVRWLLVATVSIGVLSGALLIVQAYGLARVVNGIFLSHVSFSSVRPWLWVILCLIIIRSLLTWLSQTAAARLAIRVKTDLRRQVLQHLMRLGPSYTSGIRRGEIMNTVVNGIEELEDFLRKYLPQMALAVLMPLAFLVVVLTQDWITALILAVTGPLIVMFMILVGRLAESASERQWRQLSILAAWFLDVLQGMTTLKVFGRSRQQIEWMGKASEAYRTATMKTLRVAFLSSFLLELFATLGTAVVAVSLGLRLISGHISFLIAFFVLLLTPDFYQPIRSLGSEFHAGMNGVVAAGSIFEILDAEPQGIGNEINEINEINEVNENEVDGVGQANHVNEVEVKGDRLPAHPMMPAGAVRGISIELDSVSFSYGRAGDSSGDSQGRLNALSGVTLSVGAGEMVAVVGPSGSGKSTLLDLIQGFLTPTEGTIRANGTALERWDTARWRSQVAALRQASHVFSDTVLANLLMARPDAASAELEEAAKAAQAHDFILQLPHGYQTVIGEGGVGLSGGQKQRIAVARALLKNAPLVLLDEPTAHLDAATERLVQTGLGRLIENRTAIVVAHRLSTVRKAHRIVVMQHGRIVQVGTHGDLINEEGLYRELHRAHVGGAAQ